MYKEVFFWVNNIMGVREQLAEIRRQIGNKPVTIVAATKYADTGQMREAYAAGIRHFGENRVQDALAKMEAFPKDGYPDLHWHFIGRLQTNKVNKTLDASGCKFALIHSVDSLRLARKLSDVNAKAGFVQPVLLQVNVSGEESKAGFTPEAARESLEAMTTLPGIAIRGLMTMAPDTREAAAVRSVFKDLKRLREELAGDTGIDLPELSMGMSGDFAHALEYGATMIRIGNRLFS